MKKWEDIDKEKQNAHDALFLAFFGLFWIIIVIISWSPDYHLDEGKAIVMLVQHWWGAYGLLALLIVLMMVALFGIWLSISDLKNFKAATQIREKMDINNDLEIIKSKWYYIYKIKNVYIISFFVKTKDYHQYIIDAMDFENDKLCDDLWRDVMHHPENYKEWDVDKYYFFGNLEQNNSNPSND